MNAMRGETVCLALGLLLVSGVDARAEAADSTRPVGAVYVASNDDTSNDVLVFDRFADGSVAFRDMFPTGGAGTAAGLGNQGGLVLTRDGRWLLAVNAGSNELSLFQVRRDALILMDIVPTGGERPISVTAHGNLVYVLHGAGPGDIVGFTRSEGGLLTPLDGSRRELSGAEETGPAQIQFSPDGAYLVVTEKATNRIDTYAVGDDGYPGEAVVTESAGQTPFGFAFTPRGTLVVSEAFGGAEDASAVSSYGLDDAGMLDVVSASVPTTESAACWIAITRSGLFAYTTNTASNTITGYRVNPASGALTRLHADGVTAVSGDGPIDAAFNRNSRFLYVLNARSSTISAFAVNPFTGGLTSIGEFGELPAGANGLAAR